MPLIIPFTMQEWKRPQNNTPIVRMPLPPPRKDTRRKTFFYEKAWGYPPPLLSRMHSHQRRQWPFMASQQDRTSTTRLPWPPNFRAISEIRGKRASARCASGGMADTPDLGSGPVRGGGSSPLSRTIFTRDAIKTRSRAYSRRIQRRPTG